VLSLALASAALRLRRKKSRDGVNWNVRTWLIER
jgi:hypothetical protein